MADFKPQPYDYFLVLDFEATCDRDKTIDPQEIIEFPVLKVNGRTFEVEAQFHEYVQPVVNKELTDFCTELTGITQDMVNGKPHLQQTLKSFYVWINEHGLLDPNIKFIFVTCGDWDLKTMLPSECRRIPEYYPLKYQNYLKSWINIKKIHEKVTGVYGDLMVMLKELGLTHVGRHHSGIDDCQNIANILRRLAEMGHVFNQTRKLQDSV